MEKYVLPEPRAVPRAQITTRYRRFAMKAVYWIIVSSMLVSMLFGMLNLEEAAPLGAQEAKDSAYAKYMQDREDARVADSIYDATHTLKSWAVNKGLDAQEYVDSIRKARSGK
jgi:hypothetical protein